MSFSRNYTWGNQQNEASNKRNDAPGLNNWQNYGVKYEGQWQQQNTPAGPQPTYYQQQTNLNSTQKPPSPYLWNPPPQGPYIQQQQFQFSNNSGQFFDSQNPNPYDSGQMNYNTNPAGSDPWDWGWDEPSNVSSPPYSANNNNVNDSSNWNLQSNDQGHSSFNPVHNYFQQGGSLVQPGQDTSEEYKSESATYEEYSGQNYEQQVYGKNKIGKTEDGQTENEFGGSEPMFDIKSDSAQSFQSGGSTEFKPERLSPDCNKIPLTKQALRDFCNEKYENGTTVVKHRNDTEGLTPQWSVESQMSQDTGSDDISPSVQGGSDWDHHPVEDSNWNSPKVSQKEFRKTNQEDFKKKLEDSGNQQSVPSGNILPPPPMGKSGDNAGNNPYSLGHKFSNKETQGNNVYQKPDASGNDYNLVKQMGRCSVSDDNLNQQVISGNVAGGSSKTGQSLKSEGWYGKGGGNKEELPNQETIPDNEERPEAEEHGNSAKFPPFNPKNSKLSRQLPSFSSNSDNQELAPRPDRNQYLETGQLEDQMDLETVNTDNDSSAEPLPPPGLSRLVPGEIQPNHSGGVQTSPIDISPPPPPGLDRMVLGQIRENELSSNVNPYRGGQSTPPLGLHRMVPGQLTDDQSQRLTEEPENVLSPNGRRNDIPPPGFHRMVPGESSSPETQNIIQMPMDPMEQRVVTGVAKDEMKINPIPTNIPSSSPTPANRLASQPAISEENRLQFQSERCETIGSDNVDNYGSNTGDITSVKLSKRKEGKERDRHREDISSDEAEREPPRRHDRDSDYYSKRDRNREREDSSGERYRDDRERRSKGRERIDWDRERRKDSPGRYREDRGRRRDYREDRRRHKDYDYSDEEDDADTNGYYSDRERRRYRDDYDRGYSRRDDRARSLRPEKSSKDANEESSEKSSRVSYPMKKKPFTLSSRSYESWPVLAMSLPLDIRGSGKSRRHGGYGDRDIDRDRNRDRGKDRDRSDYYRRRDDLDDFRDSQRSRPSSRNDSVQDYKHRSGRSDYEEKDKSQYRGHSKRDRDLFYPPGYNYDPTYYTYYYQYYENLRRTNPVAYAEWFRKYYAQSQHGTFDGTYTEDRGSVHSGRSSANEENKDRYIKQEPGFDFGYSSYQMTDQGYPYRSHSSDTGEQDAGRRLDSSLQMESIQRLTPAKFTTAHVKGSLTPRGQLVKILAHYPLDGQPATLEIHENVSCFDDIRKEFLNFPGPLVKGVTHKNNILKYCKQKIKDVDSNPDVFDKDSYKLIWELLILLIRQNGTVVGTDIAELLMSNRTAHVSRPQSSAPQNSKESAQQPNLSEEEVTNQFRDYLIYGNTKEALEWAMKHGLWGHALFLASKMDQRTYASVMTRFANGLTMNDPLQTLYQLMSGRQPASVTCCADEKWGDWRPHLAMILSNSTARPDLDVKAVTTLGDTLGSRGNLHAAHFCYLMGQVEFGTYAHKSSKIVLIGSSHALPFKQFSNNEAIFATEIFEFACSLADPDFALHHLQVYKLLMAKRLTEVGLVHEAVHYVEVIANTIAKFPAQYPPFFIQEVYDLGNMLKYFDPVYNNSEGAVSDPEWLLRLLNVINDYQTGILQHDGYGSVSNLTTYSENEGVQNLPLDPGVPEQGNEPQSWQAQEQMYYEHQPQQQWQQNDQSNYNFQANNKSFPGVEQPVSISSPSESNRPYWGNQNQWMQPQGIPEGNDTQQKEGEFLSGVGIESPDSNQNRSVYNYYDNNKNEQIQPPTAPAPGTVTLPNRQRTASQSENKSGHAKPKSTKKEPPKHNQSTGSWFGGIWNKFPFRPKNQMILPDDKNPSIVWDSDKNRWVNLNADEDDSASSVPPPPKASELASIPNPTPAVSPYTPNLLPGSESSDHPDASSTPNLPPSGPNKYKMTRGKSLRSNYVDVLNPGPAKPPSTQPTVPAPDVFPNMNYSSQLPTNYFIPAPVEGNENAPIDFLSPSNPPSLGRNPETEPSQPQALSRWSSTSSLSREVQKYTMKRVGNAKVGTQGVTSNTSDNYYQGNSSQWSGGQGGRYAPNHSSSLPRTKGYTT